VGHGGGVGFTAAYSGPDLGGQLRGNFKLEETYFNNGLSYGLPPTVVVNDHSRGRDGEIGATYERKIGGYDLEITGLQHLERDSATEVATVPGDNAFFGQNTRTGESILRGTVRYALNPSLNLEAGGEGAYNFLVSDERLIDNGALIALPSANVTVDEKRGELFGQATWKINPKLTLEAGARFEYSTIEESGDTSKSRSFFYAKPRLLLTWDPYTNTEVRLRVERKLGQLNFSSFVSQADLKNAIVNAGNPDLRPDQHWQFEAALEQRFWGKGSIVITGLHEELTDVADYTPLVGSNPPIDGPGNIGKGTSDQLDIEGTVPLDRLGILGGQLKTTTIWRISEVTDPVTHQSRRISGQRPDVLQGTFQQDLPQWKSTWSLTYFKGWRETYYRLGEIDRYHIGNQYMQFEWDYKPTSDLLISAQLDNLLPFKFSRHRTVWDGSRAVDPVLFDDYRTVQSQPRLYLKVRKTF
jgi:outer membrane receptor protein involved in Fe transport